MIKLKSKFDCKETYKEINSLIKDILDTRTEEGTFQSTSAFQFEEFESILFNHLFEKTNLKKELDNLKVSFESINYLSILKKINYEDNYFEKFLELLNYEINRIRDLNCKKYTLLFTTNIRGLKCRDSKDKTDSKIIRIINNECEVVTVFEKILNLFKIESIEKKRYYDEKKMNYDDLSVSEKIFDVVSSYSGEVLRIDFNSRNGTYAVDKANFIFEAFLGFLSYIHNYLVITHREGSSEDFRMFKIKARHLFLYSDDDGENLGYDIPYQDLADDFKKELYELKLVDLGSDLRIMEKINLCSRFYNMAKDIENDGLLDVLYNVFSLYYSATSAKKLDYSFFKFWIITEYLIKIHGGKTDDQMLRIMKRIVKLYYKDPFLSKRIDFLNKKRNKLVHEGEINLITQDDRNLSKIIADCLLDFYLFSIQQFELNNLSDFDFLITNIGKDRANLDNHSKILNNIKEWKE